MNGIVRSFNVQKGFGFLECLTGHPGSNPVVFFHISTVRGGAVPPVGCECSFEIVAGRRGPQAYDLKVVKVSLKRAAADVPAPGA